ncbi:hypothetical protein C8R45DRAFT_926938 [Mycena sanguinolenta]|nr:hypothetical protein C8R45DRAFT_926938 [Mycena sanguinolenta]
MLGGESKGCEFDPRGGLLDMFFARHCAAWTPGNVFCRAQDLPKDIGKSYGNGFSARPETKMIGTGEATGRLLSTRGDPYDPSNTRVLSFDPVSEVFEQDKLTVIKIPTSNINAQTATDPPSLPQCSCFRVQDLQTVNCTSATRGMGVRVGRVAGTRAPTGKLAGNPYPPSNPTHDADNRGVIHVDVENPTCIITSVGNA